MKAAGLTLMAPEGSEADQDTANRPFAGETFLLTGSLEHLTRGQAEQAITALGGKIASPPQRISAAKQMPTANL